MEPMHYTPATATAADLDALMERLDRYLRRHGSPYGEQPIQADRCDDVRQSILLDWLADEGAAEADLSHRLRTGRPLLQPTWPPIQCHLRIMLWHAGRCRRRGWRETTTRYAGENRKRTTTTSTDPDGFSGVSMASRAPDPARLASAAEEASGVLLLSRTAARHRSREGLPLAYRGRLSAVSGKAPAAFRAMRRRSTKGLCLTVTGRYPDRTTFTLEPWTHHRFEVVGSVPRRHPSRKPAAVAMPKGTTPETVRAALGME
jgi:hypothetical protein